MCTARLRWRLRVVKESRIETPESPRDGGYVGYFWSLGSGTQSSVEWYYVLKKTKQKVLCWLFLELGGVVLCTSIKNFFEVLKKSILL